MISKFQYQEMLTRTAKPARCLAGDACENEVGKGGLHEQVEAECRRRLWPYIHSRTDRKSTVGIGVVDFVIAADRGRVFWCELKNRTGKQTAEQIGFQMLLERNGHTYHLIRSFSEFLLLVDKP